jgi:hypothetical protein
MRERRRTRGLRELRLVVPDARSKAVRRRVAKQVAGLDRSNELDTRNSKLHSGPQSRRPYAFGNFVYGNAIPRASHTNS